MGSAASSSKNTVVPINQRSDGDCMFETQKQQLKAQERTLKALEEEKQALNQEISRLSDLVTELEGEKMDQADTISSLENRLEVFLTEGGGGDRYEETLKAKDQIITNLERQISENETEFTKQRARLRRKVRHYGTQVAEAKHSSAIRIMELRQEVNRLTEENEKLKKGRRKTKADTDGSEVDTATETDSVSGAGGDRGSHDLVLELSQQMLEQTNKIKRLEHSLRDREQQMEELRGAMTNNSQRSQRSRPQRNVKTGGRQWSGYSQDSGLDSDAAPDSAGVGGRQSHPVPASAASLSPLSERDTVAAATVSGSCGTTPADEELYRDITEDCNWDAASLGSSDTIGPSPRILAMSTRPTSARRGSGSRPGIDRGRSIILDPDKEHTIDSVLQLASQT